MPLASPAEARGEAVGLVLAAGRGSRFGSLKQLAGFRGRAMIEHPLVALEEAGISRRIIVLGQEAGRIRSEADLGGAEVVECPGWERGQSVSLGCGIEAAGDAGAVVVLLGDQPLVTGEAVARVVDARDGVSRAVRASYGGRPGHPVLLESSLFGRLCELEGDRGAGPILSELEATGEARLVPCEDVASDRDADTPGELAGLG